MGSAHDGQQAAVQDDDLFARRSPHDERWFHQDRQVGNSLDKPLDAALEPHLSDPCPP